MAGFNKNSRGARRGSSSSSSSSSSYVSTTTTLLVVGCCLFAVYTFTSSSSSISSTHSTPAGSNVSHRHMRNAVPRPRTVLRDPPPVMVEAHDDTQGDLPEDAVKGHHESISSSALGQENQQHVTSTSAGTEEDSLPEPEAVQHEKQQQEEEVETRRINQEEVTQQQDQAQDQQLNSDAASIAQTNEEEQQLQEPQATGQRNDDQQQIEEQNNEEHQQHQQQHQQQQQSEINKEEQNQEDTNNNGAQNVIEQVIDGSDSKEEEGGIISQSQIEHDIDGTTENYQNSQQEEQRQDHQQQQQEQQEQEQQQEQSQEQQEQVQPQEQQQQDEQQEQQLEQQQQELQQEQQQQQQQEQQEEQQQEQQEQEQEQEQQQQQQQEQQQEEHQQEQWQQESSQSQQTEYESTIGGNNENNQQNEDNQIVNEPLGDGGTQSVVLEENKSDKGTWVTQADQSSSEKERRKKELLSHEGGNISGGEWELCNVTAGPDYIPCLDNEKAIKQLHSFSHFEHRERHCPEESPTCLVPLPKGYRRSIQWPQSRDRIWYNNVPRTKLAEVKGHQNWVKVTGEYLTFPGGGTQFIHGALHYIDFIQKSVPEIAWGKHTRVILDVGCGVASFGGYLFERDVLAMSFAPKDEHEAQVQFALERGIPAISAVMGSQRLPFPSRVFDIVHCARCRVPWHANGGALLLELNRVLRPGGFFVWSATPVYQKLKEDVEIWEAMTALTKSMCWELHTIQKDKLNSVGAAMYRKPMSNDCYEMREDQTPPMCKENDDPNAAWYVPLQPCMHRVPVDPSERGSQWPQEWPRRVRVPPYWMNSSQMGVYGRPAPDDFTRDYQHWKRVVNKSYLNGFGIDWSRVRNVMDMRAVYGGFAAALKDMKLWVMNLVNIDSPDTLPIIYERGLFGMYHDWCESFSTYPRTYDLLHADRLFSQVKKRCKILPVVVEVDRITRPGGKLIVRDESGVVSEVENTLKSLHWDIRLTYSRNQEGILCAEKSDWRPQKLSSSA